jgi:hypothetical protein
MTAIAPSFVRIRREPNAGVQRLPPRFSIAGGIFLSGLASGPHKIRIRLLAEKPAPSSDRFLNVAGFEILTDTAP